MPGFMGHQNHRGSGIGPGTQDFEDAVPGGRIQSSSRFIGEDQPALAHNRPGNGDPLLLATGHLIHEAVRDFRDADLAQGVPTGEIAGRFHNTLVRAAVGQCLAAREKTGINDVTLSGGTFQNMILMRKLPAALEQEDFRVWRHRRVSTNDEGLSLGQAMIAAAQEDKQHVFGRSAQTG